MRSKTVAYADIIRTNAHKKRPIAHMRSQFSQMRKVRANSSKKPTNLTNFLKEKNAQLNKWN